MESGWYSAVLVELLLLPGCLRQNKIFMNDFFLDYLALSSLPDVEGSYVQVVAHLEYNTGAIVAVGNDDKEGEAVEDGQL